MSIYVGEKGAFKCDAGTPSNPPSKEISWIDRVEHPITRDDKYFYQIIKRLDTIIVMLEEKSTPSFIKPIGTEDEPNEDVTVELIHYGNVDDKLGEDCVDETFYEYSCMTVKY